MSINIIVAYDRNRVIGNKGKIPWVIKEDIEHFKRTTDGQIVVMGRKTWESIPEKYRPLRNRVNVVLSNDFNFRKKVENLSIDLFVVNRINIALSIRNLYFCNKDIYVIGGAQVYSEFLDRNVVDTIIATEIKSEYEGDTYFPDLAVGWERNIMIENKNFSIVRYEKQSCKEK